MAEAILERISRIPIFSTLQMQELVFSDGYCRMRVPRERAWDGIFDSLHGGIMMTAADSASAFAILTRTGPEARMTTTDMGIRFLAPCLSDLVVEARVIKFAAPCAPARFRCATRKAGSAPWPRSATCSCPAATGSTIKLTDQFILC